MADRVDGKDLVWSAFSVPKDLHGDRLILDARPAHGAYTFTEMEVYRWLQLASGRVYESGFVGTMAMGAMPDLVKHQAKHQISGDMLEGVKKQQDKI